MVRWYQGFWVTVTRVLSSDRHQIEERGCMRQVRTPVVLTSGLGRLWRCNWLVPPQRSASTRLMRSQYFRNLPVPRSTRPLSRLTFDKYCLEGIESWHSYDHILTLP